MEIVSFFTHSQVIREGNWIEPYYVLWNGSVNINSADGTIYEKLGALHYLWSQQSWTISNHPRLMIQWKSYLFIPRFIKTWRLFRESIHIFFTFGFHFIQSQTNFLNFCSRRFVCAIVFLSWFSTMEQICSTAVIRASLVAFFIALTSVFFFFFVYLGLDKSFLLLFNFIILIINQDSQTLYKRHFFINILLLFIYGILHEQNFFFELCNIHDGFDIKYGRFTFIEAWTGVVVSGCKSLS